MKFMKENYVETYEYCWSRHIIDYLMKFKDLTVESGGAWREWYWDCLAWRRKNRNQISCGLKKRTHFIEACIFALVCAILTTLVNQQYRSLVSYSFSYFPVEVTWHGHSFWQKEAKDDTWFFIQSLTCKICPRNFLSWMFFRELEFSNCWRSCM